MACQCRQIEARVTQERVIKRKRAGSRGRVVLEMPCTGSFPEGWVHLGADGRPPHQMQSGATAQGRPHSVRTSPAGRSDGTAAGGRPEGYDLVVNVPQASARTTPWHGPNERMTVLFDRDCGFCTWTVARLGRWDRLARLRYIALQDAGAVIDRPDLAAVAARYRLSSSLHVVMADGTVRSRGRAMLAILDALPGGWTLRPWAQLPGMTSLVDRIYDRIAGRRDLLGVLVARGTVACDVPAEKGERARAEARRHHRPAEA